jgi:hypothetical protein
MRRFVVFLALICVGAFAGSALAGDYHNGATLICSDCHNMHSSLSHSYNNPSVQKDAVTPPFVSTGHENLLFGDVN